METIHKIISGFLKDGSHKSVLELGSGTGTLINEIARNYPALEKIIAVDLYNQPEKIEKKVRFVKENIETLTLEEKFDLVILNHVFEHIKNPLGLIERIKGMLNKNGRILIVVPNRKGFGNEARIHIPEHGKHYFLWDKESLEFSLTKLGFMCRFHNLYNAGSHRGVMKYLPMLLRIQNPNLICMAMLENEY